MILDTLKDYFIHQDGRSAGASPPIPQHMNVDPSPDVGGASRSYHHIAINPEDLAISAESLGNIRAAFASIGAAAEGVGSTLPAAFAMLKPVGVGRQEMKVSVEAQARAVEIAINYAKEREDLNAFAYVDNAAPSVHENLSLFIEIEITYEGELGWVINCMSLINYESIEDDEQRVDYYTKAMTGSLHTTRVIKMPVDAKEKLEESQAASEKPDAKPARGLTRTRHIFDSIETDDTETDDSEA